MIKIIEYLLIICVSINIYYTLNGVVNIVKIVYNTIGVTSVVLVFIILILNNFNNMDVNNEKESN